MILFHLIVGLVLACAVMFVPGIAAGQSTAASRIVRIFSPELGGGGDFVARLIARGMSNPSRNVIVDNRGILGADLVAKAPADGSTLLLYASAFWLGPFIQDASYDPVHDFEPITLASTQPNVLVVHPSTRVNSVKELIALAKSRAGQLNYSSGATGAPTHLGAELFNSMAGIRVVRIPYKSNSLALSSLMGGETHMMFAVSVSIAPHVKSGRLKALGVTSAHASVLVPDLPPISETLPGYDAVSTYALFAPAKTPKAVIDRLNLDVVGILKSADIKEKLFNAGVEAVGSTPAELAAWVKTDMTIMGKVIRDAGISIR